MSIADPTSWASSVRLRSTLTGVPAYVPGRPAAAAPDGSPGVQDLQQREPLPAAAQRRRGRGPRGPADEPLPGHGRDRADRGDRGPRRRRPPTRSPSAPAAWACSGQILAATCGEGDEVVHAWRSFEAYPILIQLSGATGVPGAAGRRRPARPDGHGRRRDRSDPVGPGLHAQQPDRAGRARRRAGDLPGRRPARRPGRDRRGVRRVRPGVAGARTPSRSCGRGPTSPSCGPSPRPTAWPDCAWAMPSLVPTWRPRCARPRCRSGSRSWPRTPPSPPSRRTTSWPSGSTTLVAERGRVIAGLRAQGWDIPDSRGELRLARARRADDGVRGRRRSGPGWSSGRSPGPGCGAPSPSRSRPICSSMLHGSSSRPSLVTLC